LALQKIFYFYNKWTHEYSPVTLVACVFCWTTRLNSC